METKFNELEEMVGKQKGDILKKSDLKFDSKQLQIIQLETNLEKFIKQDFGKSVKMLEKANENIEFLQSLL